MHDAVIVDSRIDHGAVVSLNALAAAVIIGAARSALSLSAKSGARPRARLSSNFVRASNCISEQISRL